MKQLVILVQSSHFVWDICQNAELVGEQLITSSKILVLVTFRASNTLHWYWRHTNVEGYNAGFDKSSCFLLKWFEEGDKVKFLLTGCLRQIVVSSVLKTWGTHALVALCNTFSSRYKHSKWTHTMHMGLFSGNGVSLCTVPQWVPFRGPIGDLGPLWVPFGSPFYALGPLTLLGKSITRPSSE